MNMIHSMAGGKLRTHDSHDYAKVRVLEGEMAGNIVLYISPFPLLKENDLVLVPVGRAGSPTKACVIRVDHAVNELSFPIPIKRMKSILQIIQE